MSDLDIKNLRDLLGKATPGPWTITDEDSPRDGLLSRLLHGRPRDGMLGIIRCEHQGGYYGPANATLIVELRNAAPALLDRIEALTAERNAANKAADNHAHAYGVAQDMCREQADRIKALEAALRDTNDLLLRRIDQLMDAQEDTPEGRELQRLVEAVQPIERVLIPELEATDDRA